MWRRGTRYLVRALEQHGNRHPTIPPRVQLRVDQRFMSREVRGAHWWKRWQENFIGVNLTYYRVSPARVGTAIVGSATCYGIYFVANKELNDINQHHGDRLRTLEESQMLSGDPLKIFHFPLLDTVIAIMPEKLENLLREYDRIRQELLELERGHSEIKYAAIKSIIFPTAMTKLKSTYDKEQSVLKKVELSIALIKAIQAYQKGRFEEATQQVEKLKTDWLSHDGQEKEALALKHLLGALYYRRAVKESVSNGTSQKVEFFRLAIENFSEILELNIADDEAALYIKFSQYDEEKVRVVYNLSTTLMEAAQLQLDRLAHERKVSDKNSDEFIRDFQKSFQCADKFVSQIQRCLKNTYHTEVFRQQAKLSTKLLLVKVNEIKHAISAGEQEGVRTVNQCLEVMRSAIEQYASKVLSTKSEKYYPNVEYYKGLYKYYKGCHEEGLANTDRLKYKKDALNILRTALKTIDSQYIPNLALFGDIVVGINKRHTRENIDNLLIEAREYAERGLAISQANNHPSDQAKFQDLLSQISKLMNERHLEYHESTRGLSP